MGSVPTNIRQDGSDMDRARIAEYLNETEFRTKRVPSVFTNTVAGECQ